MAGKQVIWILAETLAHGLELERQNDLRHAQVEHITSKHDTLYRLRGTSYPVVVMPTCLKLTDIMLDRLNTRQANLIHVPCQRCAYAPH